MKNTNIIIIVTVIIAAAAIGGYFLLSGGNYSASPDTRKAAPAESLTPAGSYFGPSTNRESVIIYSDGGYLPNTLTVKTGETVIFQNQSSRPMWPASAFHPAHRAYPTTGGCLGSTFDACRGLSPGGSWSFKFDIAGDWKYHNHLSPGDTGMVRVIE